MQQTASDGPTENTEAAPGDPGTASVSLAILLKSFDCHLKVSKLPRGRTPSAQIVPEPTWASYTVPSDPAP